MAGLREVSQDATSTQTLNERLNHVHTSLASQGNRINTVLGRVNSTPQPPEAITGSAPVTMFGLEEIVQRLEDQAKRFSALADGIERIA